MSIGVAHHGEVAHDPAHVYWRLNQNILLPRLLCDPINLFPRVALKAEVIETRLNFILNNYQHEDWIFTWRSRRPEPHIMSAFEPAVAHDRKAAERRVELY